MNVSQVENVLKGIVHPETSIDIVSSGMVQSLAVEGNKVSFKLQLLSGHDPFGSSLLRSAKRKLQTVFPEAEIEAEVVPMQPEDDTEAIPRQGGVADVKNIVAIASGKGGVGKSTITANLGVALARKGYKVGVLDADVFGPSMPMMFGVEDGRPEVRNENGEDLIVPLDVFGVKMLSMGFFVSPQDALVWRGPMASNGLKQILHMGLWGDLDFLLLDLPPGTSDIHLTVVQELSLTGAVIVSTPQPVALADAQKALSMFTNRDIAVPVLGIVENMAWFEPLEFPGHRYYIFGKEGALKFAEENAVPLLAQIPLVQGIREGGDTGIPVASDSGIMANAFDELAHNFIEQVNIRNESLPPTTPVRITER